MNECDRQINDTKYYQKQSFNLTNKVQERVKEYTARQHKDNLIDYETLKNLSTNSEPKACRFYIFPKIHKQGNPGRPITLYKLFLHLLKILHTSSFNFRNLDLYRTTPSSSPCRYFLNTRQDKSLPAERICDLIRMILTMNNFSLNNEHYLQKHGTAMGIRMAPSYANLFMSKFEQQAIEQLYTQAVHLVERSI